MYPLAQQAGSLAMEQIQEEQQQLIERQVVAHLQEAFRIHQLKYHIIFNNQGGVCG